MIMTASATALLLLTLGSMAYQLISARDWIREGLETQAQIIADSSTSAIVFGDVNREEEILAPLNRNPHIRAAGVYSRTNLFAWYPQNAQLASVLNGEPGGVISTFDIKARRLITMAPIEQSGERIGSIYLESDLSEISGNLERTAMMFGVLLLVIMGFTYVLSSGLQRLISRPISQLINTIKTVSSEKNYSVRAYKESDDELGELVDGFNEMISQIKQRDGALRNINKELEIRVENRTSDLQQQFARISLLNQITYAIAERQDLQSIMGILVEQLEDKLPADYVSSYFFEPQTEMLRLIVRGPKATQIAEELQIPDVFPLARTSFAPCIENKIVYVPDLSKQESLIGQKLALAGYYSTLAIPLTVEERLIGVLVLQRAPRNGFSEAEVGFMRGMSAHVALAVRQAQLYQDLHKAYDELRQTQQAIMQQERLKALGQMASGIAHDINNALSPIIGFSDLIVQTQADLSAQSIKHLNYIKTAGQDIAHIVQRLRDFYRPRGAETLVMFNLNQLVEQVVGMTRPRWRDIPQSNGVMIEMKMELDPDVPDFAGIEAEIREAITNLILNAVDAMPKGGVIVIRTRNARLGAGPDNQVSDHVVLEIVDSGIGMDEKTKQRCFEPFFSTKGKRGTGLGLAMVYGVIERHEGKIEVDSEENKGTTIRVIFPVIKIESETSNSQEETLPGPFHILCVDDEPPVRELIREMLERDGHKIEVTDGGQAGIEAFRAAQKRNQPFDAIITDLGMPYVDGREVAATVKRESPATAVIMLTGWGAFMKSDNSKPSEVDGILSKPPHLAEVRAILRKVVKK
ncbi:MAG TPA: ATP-binding protein [Verrucomicrobiae bacterium]|jgi:signal transduction histidine kinase/ActR/RegA family two-component response regulator/HAMP domain-containing protein